MELAEKLLSAWMRATATISNRRLTNAMSYNEAAVCKALYEAGQNMTAKELCGQLHMLKSQMNVILEALRSKGIIQKQRAQSDRRRVYIQLTDEGVRVFSAEHRKNIALVEKLIADMGAARARGAADILNEAADLFGKYNEKE